MGRGVKAAIILCLFVGLAGCSTGDGWISGKLWVEHCDDGKSLGDSPKRPGEFDLSAGFFGAEILEDSNASVTQRRNGLTFRIQDTSNWMEDSNGLVVQVLDLRAVAKLYAKGEPVPVTYRAPLEEPGKSAEDDLVRARLYLYTRCPQCQQPKVASSRQLQLSTGSSGSSASSGPDCFVPTTTEFPPCPTLGAAQKQQLEALCDQDFNDQGNRDTIKTLLGGTGNGSCMYLCQFGSARRGQDPASLDDFLMEYGDTLKGFFSFAILDGRALKLGVCSKMLGDLQGMFSFDVARNRSAQSFP